MRLFAMHDSSGTIAGFLSGPDGVEAPRLQGPPGMEMTEVDPPAGLTDEDLEDRVTELVSGYRVEVASGKGTLRSKT